MTVSRSVAAIVMLVVTGCSGPAEVTSPTGGVGTTTSVVVGESWTFDWSEADEQVVVQVATPESYDVTADRYPVLYVLDGRWRFRSVSALCEVLVWADEAPQMIVVGIETHDRGRHFRPADQADEFLDLIERRVIPDVERRYRTAPHRTLIGHSLGGTLVLHALFQRPALFDAHIAISPSLRPDPQPAEVATSPFLEWIVLRLRQTWDHPEFLHLSVGDLESDSRIADVRTLVELLDSEAPPALTWQFDLSEGDTHSTVSVTGAFRGLRAVHRGWSIESIVEGGSLVGLQDHFAMLGERYGAAMQIPQSALHRMGFWLLASDRVEEAIAVFSYEIQGFPDSATAHDSLAYALEVKGDFAEAIEHCRLALALADGEEAQSIRNHLASLEARLEDRESLSKRPGASPRVSR